MANTNMLGSFSKRRMEARRFLSCISLDGSYCHSNRLVGSGSWSDCTKNVSQLWGYEVVNCDNITKRNQNVNNGKTREVEGCSPNSDSDNAISLCDSIVDEPSCNKIVINSTNSQQCVKRTNGKCERKSLSTSLRKTKIQHSLACSDYERQYGSSCESICPITTSRMKTKGIACKSITEFNGEMNIKFVKSVKDHKFNGERIIMVTKRQIPFLVFSIIPYKNTEKNRVDIHKEALRKRYTSRSRPLSTSGDSFNAFELFGIINTEDEEVSYGKLLTPSGLLKEYSDKKHLFDVLDDTVNPLLRHNHHVLARTKVLTRKAGYKWCYAYEPAIQRGPSQSITSHVLPNLKENILISNMRLYHPSLLDDPELIAGKHRTLLTFSSYVTSVIDYIRPCDLKKGINDKFKEKFPHVKLTLSKLRSLKKDMCKIAKTESGTELLTIAQAYVYFEKLILRGLINKQNRKLCAAASLLLSAKLNDYKSDALKLLIERIENIFRINRRELFESEFAVLVALEFGLHIPTFEILPHYQRLLYEL